MCSEYDLTPGPVASDARTTRPHPDGSERTPRRRSTAATGATISAAPSTMATGGHAAPAVAAHPATRHDATTPTPAPALRPNLLLTGKPMANEATTHWCPPPPFSSQESVAITPENAVEGDRSAGVRPDRLQRPDHRTRLPSPRSAGRG